MESINEKQLNFIKLNINKAYLTSKEAYELLLNNYPTEHDEIISSILLNKAISIMSACKATYYSNLNNLDNSIIENIFITFDNFEEEFLDNLITQHQWTEIEFNNYKNCVSLLIPLKEVVNF